MMRFTATFMLGSGEPSTAEKPPVVATSRLLLDLESGYWPPFAKGIRITISFFSNLTSIGRFPFFGFQGEGSGQVRRDGRAGNGQGLYLALLTVFALRA